jgi:putative membrane protein
VKIPQLVLTELRRLTASRMAILALVALMLVPVLYAGLYLWGNNDPYGNLKEVPVGLVVDDAGATTTDVNGKTQTVNFGNDVREQLLKDNSFRWIEATAAEAKTGVSDGTYDFVLTLGHDFSAALTSPNTDAPRQATVELTTNDTNSFLATTIAGQVAEQVRSSITAKVGKQAALTFLEGFATVRSNIVDAADGAGKLSDGTASALDGATTLATGAAQANTGAQQLSAGLAQLHDGSSALPSQAEQLNDGAQQVAAGNAQLADGGAEVASTVQQLADDVPAVRADIQARLEQQGFTPDQVANILAALDPLGNAVLDGNAEVQGLNSQLGQLADGSQQVADGTAQLAANAPALADGVAQAASGAADLAAGTQQLADGSTTLQSGLGELNSGAATLHSGLVDGLTKVPDQSAEQRESTAAIIANPAKVDTSAVTKASTYGAGMAPFFISLAAWIGIYALFLIVKPLSRRALTAIKAPGRITTAGWLTPGLLGVVQMIAVYVIVTVVLGYHVTNPALMLGFMGLISLTYATIILALNVWLGSVGQFLGLVLMVLQLVTAGGTFPWQTLPGPLAALHHALPMSYAVDGIRQLMYGGDLSLALGDAAVLLAFLLGALALSWLGASRMTRHRTLRDLRPSLIG